MTPGAPTGWQSANLSTTWHAVSQRIRAFASSISLWLIVGAHVWRYVGLGFLIAYFLGRLPAEFAIPESLGDIVAAAFALPLALALRRDRPVRGYFVFWNVFGLVDLLSAITVGILYSEGSVGILREGVSTAFMTTFPVKQQKRRAILLNIFPRLSVSSCR